MNTAKKFTKMTILPIFQTGNFRVLKMGKIAIFVNFLAARVLAARAEFKICNRFVTFCNYFVTIHKYSFFPEKMHKNTRLQNGYNR